MLLPRGHISYQYLKRIKISLTTKWKELVGTSMECIMTLEMKVLIRWDQLFKIENWRTNLNNKHNILEWSHMKQKLKKCHHLKKMSLHNYLLRAQRILLRPKESIIKLRIRKINTKGFMDKRIIKRKDCLKIAVNNEQMIIIT
jgi:hypothetical protein